MKMPYLRLLRKLKTPKRRLRKSSSSHVSHFALSIKFLEFRITPGAYEVFVLKGGGEMGAYGVMPPSNPYPVGGNSSSGTISISSIPTGAKVEFAQLAVSHWYGGYSPQTSTASFDGNYLGEGTYDAPSSDFFRFWDVTQFVSGNGSHQIAIQTWYWNYHVSVSLSVVYSHISLPERIVNYDCNVGPIYDTYSYVFLTESGIGNLWVHTASDSYFGNPQLYVNGQPFGSPLNDNLGGKNYGSLTAGNVTYVGPTVYNKLEGSSYVQDLLIEAPVSLPPVSIKTDTPTVNEGGVAKFQLFRSPSNPLQWWKVPVSVTVSGTAKNGEDYENFSNSTLIPSGSLATYFKVNTIADGKPGPDKTLKLQLDEQSVFFNVGQNPSAEIVILNNDGFEANDDTVSTPIDTAISVKVLNNDNNATNVVSVGPAGKGTVTNNGDSVTYTPNPQFFGIDQFTYTATDGFGHEKTATVKVTVGQVFPQQSVLMTGADCGGTCENEPGDEVAQAGGFGSADSGDDESEWPVRYADGVLRIASPDLHSTNFGTPWGITRSWTNSEACAPYVIASAF